MLVMLNTDVCPIVIPDTYGTEFCHYVREDMWEDFKQLMIDKAESAIKYALDDLGIYYKELVMGGFHSPREYNFSTDWINFGIDIEDDYITIIKRNVMNDETNFFRFAKEKFGSYDGFISFYPTEKNEFYGSNKTEYILSMWIMYRMNEENDIEDYQRAYLDDVEEYASGNGYMETEDDYEDM